MNMTASASFDTLRWRNGALELLDQRLLPEQCTYVRCHSASTVADAIRAMVVRGAPAIGCAAAYGYAAEALALRHLPVSEFNERLARGRALLNASRPTAVNLSWALARMHAVREAAQQASPATVAGLLLEAAHQLCADDIACNRELGRHGSALLPDTACVLTHCNAGALATAGHGTALGVIRSAVAAGKRIQVIADETRPYLQGARLTAWELQRDGIPVTLIADVAAGLLMARKRVDAVIVGADRVAANGDVANKIGTYPLAVLAHRHGLPFYVACPLSTVDLSIANGDDIPIEERDPTEVLGYRNCRWGAPGVGAINPVFDVTPAALVTALITERGVLHAPDARSVQQLVRPHPAP